MNENLYLVRDGRATEVQAIEDIPMSYDSDSEVLVIAPNEIIAVDFAKAYDDGLKQIDNYVWRGEIVACLA